MKNPIVLFTLVAAVLFSVVACVHSRQPSSLPARPSGLSPHSVRGEAPKLCAAIRGNGELVMAHFAALAALSERFGPFDGLAGGSSASISSFLYESVLENPAVWECPDCTKEMLGARVSLLLKSIWEYLAVLENTEEARALQGLQRILSTGQEKTIGELLNGKTPEKILEAISQMNSVLESPELGDLVNPELADMLSPLKVAFRTYDARQAFDSIRAAGKFDPNDRRGLFRPGLLNFSMLANKIGRIGSFYAGYGSFFPQKRFKAFLDDCAEKTRGWTWHEIKKNHPECTAAAHEMIDEYRKAFLADEIDVYSRVQDPVGMSAHVLVVTTLLRGAQIEQFENVLQRYRDDNDFDKVPFDVFEDLKIGYWGSPRDLAKLDLKLRERTDLKSTKHFILDDGPWSTALAYSPAEPGLARLRRIGRSSNISAAGWGDLAPTLALRAIGCDKVYYITRRGEESKFARGVARTLGMTPKQDGQLYDLTNRKSSFSQSIGAADKVWCTDWDHYEVWQGEELERDSYRAPLVEPTANDYLGCHVPPKRKQPRPE